MAMPDFVIETADPLDWPGMLCLLQTANLHHIPSPEMPGLALETTFVARNGAGLAGIGGYKMTCPNAAKTTLLAVHPNYLGSPIGQQLQERRMAAAKVAGAETLTTNCDLPTEIDWYKQLFGYREVGHLPKLHSFGAPDIDCWTTLETDLTAWTGPQRN